MSHHMKIFTDLIECKIKPNKSINLYSTRLSIITSDIKQIDADFNDCYENFQLLRFLPRKYDSIVQDILRLKDANFKFVKIVEESNQLSFAKKKSLAVLTNSRNSDSGSAINWSTFARSNDSKRVVN